MNGPIKGSIERTMDLMKKTNSFPEKDALAMRFSLNRTTHLGQMHQEEIDQLIYFMLERADSMDKMRKKIIAIAHKLGWKQVFNPDKADYVRIDTWCVKYGSYKKKLNLHAYTELADLTSQFEKMSLNPGKKP